MFAGHNDCKKVILALIRESIPRSAPIIPSLGTLIQLNLCIVFLSCVHHLIGLSAPPFFDQVFL